MRINSIILREANAFNQSRGDYSDWGMDKKVQRVFEKCGYNSLFGLLLDNLTFGFYFSSVKRDIRRALRGETNESRTKTSLRMAAEFHRKTILSEMSPGTICYVSTNDVRNVFKTLGWSYNPFRAGTVRNVLGEIIVRRENPYYITR